MRGPPNWGPLLRADPPTKNQRNVWQQGVRAAATSLLSAQFPCQRHGRRGLGWRHLSCRLMVLEQGLGHTPVQESGESIARRYETVASARVGSADVVYER